MGLEANATPKPLYAPQDRDLVPTVYKAGWASGAVWMGAENLVTTGIQCVDCPAHSELLYQLHELILS